MGIESVLAFLSIAVLFIITPGIDTFYVLNNTLLRGRSAGLQSGLGVNVAMFIQIIVLGLVFSFAIAQFDVVLQVIKIAGAIYLSVLGGKLILKTTRIEETQEKATNAFWGGMLTNFLNPKAALFIVAFFPQFIEQESLTNPFPYLSLGVLYTLLGILWFTLLAILGGKLHHYYKKETKGKAIFQHFVGLLFIFFGFLMIVMP